MAAPAAAPIKPPPTAALAPCMAAPATTPEPLGRPSVREEPADLPQVADEPLPAPATTPEPSDAIVEATEATRAAIVATVDDQKSTARFDRRAIAAAPARPKRAPAWMSSSATASSSAGWWLATRTPRPSSRASRERSPTEASRALVVGIFNQNSQT
jgi:hypothetical protein